MKLSDERLDEVLDQLHQGKDISGISREEWASITAELRALRLRTSPQSRSATSSAAKLTH